MASVPQIITRQQMQTIAPSVFADSPWEGMSERYRQIPTIEVIDRLADQGFLPVAASQSRSRVPGKGMFTKHLLRLRHEDFLRPGVVGDEIPELVLTNSHDGSGAYRFLAGIFRLVCSNGMIVQSSDFGGVSVRHQGGADFDQKVLDATFSVVENTQKVTESISEWKQLALPAPKQLAYANAASELMNSDNIKPEQLLKARRTEDQPDSGGNRSVWGTFNTVQENLMKGGLTGYSPRGRRVRTRPIKNVQQDVSVNRALWRLTEEMAKLAS